MDKKPVGGKKQGAILIAVFLAIALLVIISIGMFLRMFSESRASERHRELTQAFYLAEAAIDKAISKLPSNTADESGVALGQNGRYSLSITVLEAGKKWKAVGTGYVPNMPPNARTQKRIEAFLEKKDLDDDFWNNFIYSAENVEFKGSAYISTGDVRFAGSLKNGDNVPLENRKYDPSINPLALLDFDYLKQIAQSQTRPDGHNNYFPVGDKSFPTSFWYDEAAGIPNVVFIEGDLRISGGHQTIGGFIIVPGNYSDTGADPNNVTITGNASIEGCLYTRGYFSNRGGGDALNVNGGIWAGKSKGVIEAVDIRGGIAGKNNQIYMDAIRNNINPSTEVQIISWREESVP